MPYPQYPYQYSDNFQQDRLIAGLTQTVTETGTLAAGQVVVRGTVLGRISATGKLVMSLAASTDGSQVPYGIAVDFTDASQADQFIGTYIKGEFNQNALVLGAGQTLAAIHDPLRDAGIYLKPVVPA